MTTAAAVTIGEQVRLSFHGWPAGHPKTGQPLELSWNSRQTRIMPGQDAIVPFDLAKLYFGDPRAGATVRRDRDHLGQDMIIADRLAECKRLSDLWLSSEFGTNQARFKEFVPGDRSHFAEGLSDMLPLVEIRTLTTDEKILMVTDDPYGDHVVVATMSRSEADTQRQQLQEQSEAIRELREQNAQLMAKLGLAPDPTPARRGQKTEPGLTTPTEGSVGDARMVFNPRTNKVTARRTPQSDPTDIHDLPQDTD